MSPALLAFGATCFGQKGREAVSYGYRNKECPPARRVARRASAEPASAGTEFLIFEDNGGGYHWTIVDRAGESLARSGSFASHDEAEHAARVVRDNAGAAGLEHRVPDDPPIDLATRRDAAAGDGSDAERWLDEGGSFSREAVTQWPAPR